MAEYENLYGVEKLIEYLKYRKERKSNLNLDPDDDDDDDDSSYTSDSDSISSISSIEAEPKQKLCAEQEQKMTKTCNCLVCLSKISAGSYVFECPKCSIMIHQVCWSTWVEYTKVFDQSHPAMNKPVQCIHCRNIIDAFPDI